MSSETYWKDREAHNLAQNQLEEEEYSRRLKAIYQNQLDAIQKEIDGFYGKYAGSEGITLAEAKKRVAKLDIEAYERKAARYVAEKNFSEKANEEMRLYNATMKINRLELLKANIGLELIAGHEELDRFMEEILQGRTEDELKRQAGILGKTVQQNAKTAESIVNASFHNATFSDRIWMYQDLLKNELSSALQSGLIQGKNPRELARTIRQKFDVQVSNAERLMRTELARVQTDAQKRSMEENGFEEYEFIANGHCCPICDALDGKHFNLRDLMPGKNAPPMHPNCVLPNTKIIAPDAEAMMRSEYSGNIIEIGTSNGTRLSVTPNHIVLTARGWVRAKNLVKGDKVVHYCNWTKSVVKANPANDDSISTVEQLFASLIKASTVPTFSMPVSPEDLKGDVIKDGKVDIIFIDSKLRSKVDSAVNKLISDIELIGTSIAGKSVFTAKCTLAELLVGVGLASDGIMSSSCVSNILFSRALTHRELVGLRLSSDYNSRLNKTAADNTSADVKAFGDSIFARTGIVERDNLFCIDLDSDSVESDAVSFEQSFDRRFGNTVDLSDLFRAFSGVIELDDIVLVTNKFYSGHVYDASSLSTLYISNGIITSNCRCSTAAYEDDEEYRAWLEYLEKGGTTEEWNSQQHNASLTSDLKRASGRAGDTDGYTTIDSVESFDFNDSDAIKRESSKFFMQYSNAKEEHAVVISPNGNLYRLTGDRGSVNTALVGEDVLKGSIGMHNHPVLEGFERGDSFSDDDVYFSAYYQTGVEYLVTGNKIFSFKYTGSLSPEELLDEYDKAKELILSLAFIDDTVIEYQQEEIMKYLSEHLEGVEYHEHL